MAYKVEDNVLVSGPVFRKNPKTNKPETINLSDEAGVVKRAQTYKNKAKNQYHVTTKYGSHFVNESKLSPVK